MKQPTADLRQSPSIDSGPIDRAKTLPNGARFYRSTLQVNPFEYIGRHATPTRFSDEASYNNAIVQACLEQGIEVIAVTDHYRVRSALNLQAAAKAAGLYVFPGFEAVTKDGVHILCIFDPDREIDSLERVIGDCGIHDESAESPTGKYDVRELLDESKSWGAICIAAHVASRGGLLRQLSGQARAAAWRSPNLLACSLPGAVEDAPDDVRAILKNKDPQYERDRPIAILNAQDVSDPDDLAKPGASTWIKMSKVSVEGLRQAFLDPQSRIRLVSDPVPEEHAEFSAMAWEGGFLDGAAIQFNENLNVLIGGRGTGKSTVIESLRYVLGLEPLGEEARKAHEGIVRNVLRSGTKISLLVGLHTPAKREYKVERTIPNPPIVRDESGTVRNLTPSDVIPRVEIFGQHEISELTRSPEKLTSLLDRFVERDPSLARRKAELKRELERSRIRFMETRAELEQIEERLAALPALEETLKRFQEAGLEDRLKEQSLLVREERVLRSASERVERIPELLDPLRRELPIDRAFLSEKALEDLPAKDILVEANRVLGALSGELEGLLSQIDKVLELAKTGLASVRARWQERAAEVKTEYEKILRELQRSKVDGEEFIRLRRQIEELRPLKERKSQLQRLEKEQGERRRNLLAEWEDVKAKEFRQLEGAAKRISRELAGRVQVEVAFAGNREPLFELLRERVGGRLKEAFDALSERGDLSLKEFADAARGGAGTLRDRFGLTPAPAKSIAEAPADVVMQIEELDLAPSTTIKLNVAAEGQPPAWQALDDLSTGQKATAVLLLLLLESDAPLVVDQPEDDLDNRFITESVVPKMRDEKRQRQFVFSTHNANIPVLGDAELILGLSASGEPGSGTAMIPPEHMASIDSGPVRDLVEEILEGGKEAFEMRRLKYGF